MALVAYDNSDSSEYEDEDIEKSTVVILNKHVEVEDGKCPILFIFNDILIYFRLNPYTYTLDL